MRRTLRLAITIFATCSFLLAANPAWSEPTAILVDTSRSIGPARFDEAKQAIAALLPALAAEGPVAVYAFNDTPVKAADFTTDTVALQQALAGLRQGGSYTLLYDCFFSAVRDLEARKEPGVVLLVTDGRDENSAVTLEDAASRATSGHIAVVSLGIGTLVDVKSLRRIAALTGGRYAGQMPEAGAEALSTAFRETQAALVPFPPPPTPVKTESAPLAVPAAPKAAETSSPNTLLWIILIALLVGVAVLALVIMKRTTKPEEISCEDCGRPLNSWEKECPSCLAKALSITNPGAEPEHPAAPPVPEIDPELLKKMPPSSESLDHTIILDEVPVLILKRANSQARMYQLPTGQVASIGRDKVNTIQVVDQAMSGQHFRIVPKEGTFYLVDLESTNGTFLNGERVTLKELKPGGMIHAGQCEFAFRLDQRKIN